MLVQNRKYDNFTLLFCTGRHGIVLKVRAARAARVFSPIFITIIICLNIYVISVTKSPSSPSSLVHINSYDVASGQFKSYSTVSISFVVNDKVGHAQIYGTLGHVCAPLVITEGLCFCTESMKNTAQHGFSVGERRGREESPCIGKALGTRL